MKNENAFPESSLCIFAAFWMCLSWANFSSWLFEYILAAQRCNFSKCCIPAEPRGGIVQFQVSLSLNPSQACSFFPSAFAAGPTWKIEGLRGCQGRECRGEVLGWRPKRTGGGVWSSIVSPDKCQAPNLRIRIVFNSLELSFIHTFIYYKNIF